MVLFQAICLGLIALILTPGWLFYFDVTPKLAKLLVACAVLLPLAVTGARPRRTAGWLAVLYGASLIASTCFSTHPALSWFGTNWRRFGALSQVAVLIFAWSVAAGGNRRVLLRAV